MGVPTRSVLSNPLAFGRRIPDERADPGVAIGRAVAMVMACNPRLLIADEPTTALDVTVQATILDLLRDLQEQTGVALLFVTHDLGVVAELCGGSWSCTRGRSSRTAPSSRSTPHPSRSAPGGSWGAIPVPVPRAARPA